MAWWAAIPALMSMMNQGGGQGGQGGQGGGGGMGGGWGQSSGARMSGIASGLFNLFGAKDPSDAANQYLSQMTPQAQGYADRYMQPYINAGMRAMPTLEEQYNNLIKNPTGMMNQIGSTFQQSPGYQWQVDQATRAANNAGAASGMAGSQAEQQNLAQTVNGLANQDYYNYLGHGLNQYQQGLGGLSNINQMGYGASSQAMNAMIQAAIQQAMAQSENAYSGAANQNQMRGGAIGSIMGGLF